MANNVTLIETSDIVAKTNTTLTLYSDVDFNIAIPFINLSEGANNGLYIKATAADSAEVFYEVTVTRTEAPKSSGGCGGYSIKNTTTSPKTVTAQ